MNVNDCSNIVGNVNVDGDKIFYSPDTNNLDSTPSVDIFGYLMASQGVTVGNHPVYVVGELYKMKSLSKTYLPYIKIILDNIIIDGSIEDYMEHLSDEPNKFISSWGEYVDVKDLSWI